jgi:SAM-dependent methyltransferase
MWSNISMDRLLSARYINDGQSICLLNELQRSTIDEFKKDKRIKYIRTSDCVLCDNTEFTLISRKDRYGQELDTVVCDKCGLVFSLMQLDQQSLVIFYSEYYRAIYEGIDKLTINQINAYYIKPGKSAKFVKKADVVIDIGTGGGWNLLPYRDYKHYGFDYDLNLLEYGREKYGLNLIAGGVDKAKKLSILGDYLICRHVLEHTSHPVNFLTDFKNILNPNGVINISVPCIDYLLVDGFSFLHFLQNAHNFYFDTFTLRLLVLKCGFYISHGLGGNVLLANADIEKVNHEYNKINLNISNNPRGDKVVKYLKLCEKTVTLKNIFPEPIKQRLYYFYYALHPVKALTKYLHFGKIVGV